MTQCYLSCGVETAAHEIYDTVVNGSVSGECIENYTLEGKDGKCVVMVFEKHFWRNGSRASLTVTIDNINGKTRMTATGSGGGQGIFFSIDWGAAGSFEGSARRAVENYII